jgi:sugar O-acyltransferase (sialic acid O-acetyltransferase NeuD family)
VPETLQELSTKNVMGKPIYIFGAGGLGREFNAMLHTMPEWNVKGFYDDRLSAGTFVDGIACLGGMEILRKVTSHIDMIIAIGDPKVKHSVIRSLSDVSSIHYPVIIHPSAQLLGADKININPGTVIAAGCILTTNITLGRHVLVNLNTTIGHDTVIGDESSIMPGVNLAGQVTVGKNVLIGSGANVLKGLTVGDGARVGAGAVVTKNVATNTTVTGVPAK